jgi:hypothetical protein
MAITGGLPRYYVGRRLFAARISGLTIDAQTGVFTKYAPADFAGWNPAIGNPYLTAKEVVFSQKSGAEEIHPANWYMENNVPTVDSFEVVAREIKYANPGQNALVANWVGFDYFLIEVVVSPDQGATIFTVQAVCRRAAMEDGYGPGESEFELHGDTAGLPIAYVAAGQALIY